MKFKIFTLLGLISCLSLVSCSNFKTHKIIRIEMSPETVEYYQAMGYNNRLELEEKYWSLTEEYILSRKNGYVDMPTTTVDSSGKTINLITYSNYSAKWNEMDYVSSFTPKDNSYNKIILYIHGGAYCFGAYPQHTIYCDNLSNDNNALVVAPNYGLAPECNYKQAYNMLNNIYDKLLTYNKQIIIAGDSAGGGLATSFILYLKSINKKLPNKVILSSPWLDLTMSNPDIANYEAIDRSLAKYGLIQMGKWWSGDQFGYQDDKIPTSDYRVSPINGDFSKFPKTLMFGCTCEVFYPDMNKFLDILDEKHVKSTFVELNGFAHVSNLKYDLKEYKQCLNIVKDFIS